MKSRKPSKSDFAALNRGNGAVVVTYPPDGGRIKVNAPAEPKPRRRKGGK